MITIKYYLTSVPHMIHSDSKPRKENIMPDKISSVKRGGRTIIYDPDTGKPTLYINKNGELKPIAINPAIHQSQPRECVISPFWDLVLGVIMCALIGMFFAGVLIEWLAGCGEREYFADGTWRTIECVFQDNEIYEGRWK